MSALNELQNYTFVSKYARWIESESRRETWREAVDRVRNMMHTKYADKNIAEEIDWAYDLMFKKKILGSQRCLQFGGDPILKRNSKLYNCTASYCDRLRFFQECFWLLLCGSGTGFSVQKHHVSKLPTLSQTPKDKDKGVKYVIEDSIEGWADSLGVLLSSYFSKPSELKFKEYKDQYIVFDYSQIRPKGSPLTSGVGKAPGFEPLQNGIEKIRELLDRCVANEQKKLRPIDAYDIVMHSSDAVLSGGVRRCIAKGSKVLVLGCSYKNIEDVVVGDKVSTINGWRKVSNTFNQGTQKVITVKHQEGSLECTPNHRIAVLNHDQEIVWKYAENLTKKDTLVFVKNNDFVPASSFLPEFSYVKPENSTTCKNIKIPELDEKIAWLLGEIQGDGYIRLTDNSGEVSVACEGTNPDKAIEISNQLERFGVNVSIQQPKPEDNCYKIRVKSKQLAQYFHDWLKQAKSTLRIPECIKSSETKIKLAYLQGILDADGHIGPRCQQVVCTIYKNFAKELQSLLYSINIVSRFKKLSSKGCPDNWQKKYGLFLINNEDKELFNNNTVGFKRFSISAVQKNSNSYDIKYFEQAKNKELPKNWHKYIASNQKNIPYSTWNKVFGDSNIVPIKVCDIINENIETETFDIEVEDDHNFICEGVLVHNSASLALFSADDEEMAKAKTGNWYIDNPQRARSNNSALLLKDGTSYEDFKNLMESVKEFGEPGFIWGDSTEMVFNPCVEISLWPVNEKTGESGWQGCNLSTINCSSITDENDFYERCKAAALIGTLQAGFTGLEYLGKNSEEIFEREALLGVSMTGIMEKHDLILTEKVLKAGAKIAVETNKEMSKKIGINQAARVTCLKPEGTSSSMLGTSSGIHPHHAKRYIRHVQANVLEPPYQYFKSYNPHACEKSAWSANNTDEVIKFPIEVPDGSKLKNQLPAVEMLAVVKDTQKNWVQSGKNRSLCTQDYLCHNVSNTVTVKPEEWEDVTKYIYDNRKYFAGISLIPQSGDKDYPQAPFTTVYTSREIVKEYGDAALWCSGLIELGLNAFNNNLWAACDYMTLNQATDKDGEDKKLFVTKMRRFAKKYFNDDIRRLTYCMKDVYNWKIYTDLYDSFTKVDYTQLHETEDNTVGIEEISCAGGACLI